MLHQCRTIMFEEGCYVNGVRFPEIAFCLLQVEPALIFVYWTQLSSLTLFAKQVVECGYILNLS
jgi:hypothetical protein